MKNIKEECSCSDEEKKVRIDDVLCLKLSSFFKVFGDLTRMRILSVLLIKELSVCEISTSLGISHSLSSHQLGYLKKHKLVKFRKEGKVVFYSLDDSHVEYIIKEGLVHINEK